MTRTLLITGGCGFIGANFVRHILNRYPDYRVINLDKLTYAGNPANLADIAADERYRFVHGDITDADAVDPLVAEADCVVNFAAESHVDRSILGSADFLHTNIDGTFVLLDAARRHEIDFPAVTVYNTERLHTYLRYPSPNMYELKMKILRKVA